MHPGPPQVVGEVGIVGAFGEEVGDRIVIQTIAADLRIEISSEAARIIVQPTSTPDRRAEHSDVPRRAKVHFHVLEGPVIDAATTGPWRYVYGEIHSRERV